MKENKVQLFDINTATGHWPFRKLPINTVSELQDHLEKRGVDGAAVVNINAVFYKNCQDANLELYDWIGSQNNFFTGIATINPFYPKWDKDLTEAVAKYHFRGLRLIPQYHDYQLNDLPEKVPQMAAALDIPIFISHRIVDVRQKHWMDTDKAIDFSEVYNLCQRHPKTKVVFTESITSANNFENKNMKECPNLFLEISRMRSTCGQQLSKIAAKIGCDRLLFGSGSPFKETTPSIIKLQQANLTESEKKAIAAENAVTLLGSMKNS